MSNFVLIGYYLLYDLYAYILYIILNYKNLQFKQFIDDIAIDFSFFRNFVSMEVMFFTFLIYMSTFVLIGYYLLCDLYAYILHIILNYKNLQFK